MTLKLTEDQEEPEELWPFELAVTLMLQKYNLVTVDSLAISNWQTPDDHDNRNILSIIYLIYFHYYLLNLSDRSYQFSHAMCSLNGN